MSLLRFFFKLCAHYWSKSLQPTDRFLIMHSIYKWITLVFYQCYSAILQQADVCQYIAVTQIKKMVYCIINSGEKIHFILNN